MKTHPELIRAITMTDRATQRRELDAIDYTYKGKTKEGEPQKDDKVTGHNEPLPLPIKAKEGKADLSRASSDTGYSSTGSAAMLYQVSHLQPCISGEESGNKTRANLRLSKAEYETGFSFSWDIIGSSDVSSGIDVDESASKADLYSDLSPGILESDIEYFSPVTTTEDCASFQARKTIHVSATTDAVPSPTEPVTASDSAHLTRSQDRGNDLIPETSFKATNSSSATFNCDESGCIFHSYAHNVTLCVPKNATPKRKKVEITFKCSMKPDSDLVIPEGYVLVSPVVCLCSNPAITFEQPIEISIPHCVDTDRSEVVASKRKPLIRNSKKHELVFMKASHYESKIIDGKFKNVFERAQGFADFKTEKGRGRLLIKHFCHFCIVQGRGSSSKINFYLTMVTPKTKSASSERVFNIDFCVTYLLPSCIELLREQYSDKEFEQLRQDFQFAERRPGEGNESIQIALPQECKSGWRLICRNQTTVLKEQVDFMQYDYDELELLEKEKTYPPRVLVRANGTEATASTIVAVKFTGSKKPVEFGIDLLKNAPPQHSSPKAVRPTKQFDLYNPPRPCLTPVSDEPTEIEMDKVAVEIINRMQYDWKKIKPHLKIPQHIMQGIEQSTYSLTSKVFDLLRYWRDATEGASKLEMANMLDYCDPRLHRIPMLLGVSKDMLDRYRQSNIDAVGGRHKPTREFGVSSGYHTMNKRT